MPSPSLWYSKYVKTGRESEKRGRELEKLIGELDLELLNRLTDLFTFSWPMGESDIDNTVVNGGWVERFVCDTWEVNEDPGVSDHNCLLISVEGVRKKFKAKIKKRGWSMGNVNWEMFKSELGREAYMTSPESFARLPGREQLESLHGWICIAMDKATKRFVKGKDKRVV